MALITTLQELELIQAAILKVYKGQSGTWDGKALTLADLPALTAREKELRQRYQEEQGTVIARNTGVLRRG